MLNHKKSILLIKHFLASTACALIELSLFYFLHVIASVTLLGSHSIAFSCATLVGYVLHSFFTFEVGRLRVRNAAFFAIQALLALAIGYQILLILVTAGIQPMFAKLFQLSVTFLFNVLFGKFFSFKK